MTVPPYILLMVLGVAVLITAAMFDMGSASPRVAKRARALGAVGRTGASARHERAVRRAPETPIDAFLRRYVPRPATLRARLEGTGYPITFSHYGAACLAVAAIVLTLALVLGAPASFAVLEAVASGVWLPHVAVGLLAAHRRAKFFKAFPEAIGLIVRGLRAGLPVSETISVVGREISDPVGEEFRRIADQVRLGGSLEDAMWQTARRLSLPEFNFLVISLSVQRETGGNLAETLENLEHILRRRQQMRLKIRAMASEATASALIIGALPFVMAALMFMVSGEYMRLLFSDPFGRLMVGAALASLTVGALVMRQMVRFEV